MKKTILFSILALLGMTQAVAQDYEYVPFVREGVKWVYFYNNFDDPYPANPNLAQGKVYLNLEFKGDTVINGKTYKLMHKYYGNAINIVNDTVPICMREEDKVVYAVVPEGKVYHDCPIGNCATYQDYDAIRNGQEFVLYDFSNAQACWQNLMNSAYEDQFTTDVITIGGHRAKRYSCDESFKVVEGVGMDSPTGYTLSFFMPMIIGDGSVNFGLSHVMENGKIIYKGELYEEPEDYVPFVREGVKWVYFYENYYSTVYGYDENLALGKNFLTLEIKGDTVINGKAYKAMHKYSGSAIDWDHDTIPLYLREEDRVVYGIVPESIFYYDCLIGYGPEYLLIDGHWVPMEGLYGQIYTGQEFVLYDFADTKSYYESEKMFDPNIFDEFEFSYVGSDITTVGGVQVKRHVINRWNLEDYLIESVGFDGHNSGFTLHYLYNMTYADPRFHLSHVVENGQIIYKGIYFDPSVHVGIDEVVTDKPHRAMDGNYYNLMGQPVGKEVPTTPGIYIHNGKKICVSRMP